MPISNDEFNSGERTAPERNDSATATSPSSQTVKKTVQHKGQVKEYGQYNQRKFFVKFMEGPDDKAMFHDSHWSTFKSGDKIEFESKYNPESEWHAIHKKHYVGVIEKDKYDTPEVEIETEVDYVTKWEEEDGELTCKTHLKDEADGIKTVVFNEGTIFTDRDFEYSKCKVFGIKEGAILKALTVEVLTKKRLYHQMEIPLNELDYYEGSIGFSRGEFKGSLEVPWSSVVLNKDKDNYIGSIHIYSNFRVHGRWYKESGIWVEKAWYTLEDSRHDIQMEYIANFEEIISTSLLAGFIKKVKENLKDGYYNYTEVMDMAKESGIVLQREYIRELFWRGDYSKKIWDTLIELAGEPRICDGFFIFDAGDFQVFGTPKMGECIYVFKDIPSMNLAQKVKLFREKGVAAIIADKEGLKERTGYYGSIYCGYLDLWKVKLLRIF